MCIAVTASNVCQCYHFTVEDDSLKIAQRSRRREKISNYTLTLSTIAFRSIRYTAPCIIATVPIIPRMIATTNYGTVVLDLGRNALKAE